MIRPTLQLLLIGVKPNIYRQYYQKLIPNGTTGIINGLVSFIPFKKFFDLLVHFLKSFLLEANYKFIKWKIQI